MGHGNAVSANKILLGTFYAAAVVGVTILLGVEHEGRLRIGEENTALRRSLDQMASVAAEHERLSNLLAQANAAPSIAEERLKELLRLRSEVDALRQQSKEIEALREDTRRARAAQADRLKAQNGGQALNTASGPAATESRLQILKAEYWTENARMDVTDALRNRIRGDSLKAIASNNLNGDPEFGQVKHLTVEYRFAGVTMTNEFREGDFIVLPTE